MLNAGKIELDLARVDWNISSKMTAFFKETYYDQMDTYFPHFGHSLAVLWGASLGSIGKHNWTIGQHLVTHVFVMVDSGQGFSQQGTATRTPLPSAESSLPQISPDDVAHHAPHLWIIFSGQGKSHDKLERTYGW